MGKKWLLAVKKIFSSESKEDSEKSKKKNGDKWKDSAGLSKESKIATSKLQLKQARVDINDRNQHSYAIAMAAVAQAAAEMTRLTASSLRAIHGRARREAAAIKIQAVFRGYLTRRGTRTLRGLLRLKLMANRNAVKRQTINTLHIMQTLARVQSQIRERRIRVSEENQALYMQRQLKREKDLDKSKLGEDWVHSPQSKEQFEAKLQKKQEAALRRERTLAYAYSHQWRSNSARSKKPAFIDPSTQQWGWSWLERWSSASRPWESRNQAITRNSSKASSKEDICTMADVHPDQHRRRHSIGGSLCFGDAESKAKSRFQAPLTRKSMAKYNDGLTRKKLPLFTTAKRLGMER